MALAGQLTQTATDVVYLCLLVETGNMEEKYAAFAADVLAPAVLSMCTLVSHSSIYIYTLLHSYNLQVA